MLTNLITELGIEAHVSLCDFTKEPFSNPISLTKTLTLSRTRTLTYQGALLRLREVQRHRAAIDGQGGAA